MKRYIFLIYLLITNISWSQGGFCLQDLELRKVGEVSLSLPWGETELEVIGFKVSDFLFDDAEVLSSAAYVLGSADNQQYHLWSVSAYPQGFIEQLGLSVCGEDVLDALDAYRYLSRDNDPFAGATAALSPSQAAIQAFLRKGREDTLSSDDLAKEQAALATIKAFEDRLPNRQGAWVINFRADMFNPMAIMMRFDLSEEEKLKLLEFSQSPQASAALENPALLPCPCEMSVLEAHLFQGSSPPYAGESLSWGSADARKAGFSLSLERVLQNPDGSYAVEARFAGSLFAMRPDPAGPSQLALMSGIPDMLKDAEAIVVTGTLRLDYVLPARLSGLPKVF